MRVEQQESSKAADLAIGLSHYAHNRSRVKQGSIKALVLIPDRQQRSTPRENKNKKDVSNTVNRNG